MGGGKFCIGDGKSFARFWAKRKVGSKPGGSRRNFYAEIQSVLGKENSAFPPTRLLLVTNAMFIEVGMRVFVKQKLSSKAKPATQFAALRRFFFIASNTSKAFARPFLRRRR